MSRRWERTWRELRPEVHNCILRLRLRLRYDGWKIMMSIVASHDNSNPRQSRRDDESGHRRSRHNRFARMVLQLHNQTARPQLPQMIPRPHQSCRRRNHQHIRQTMILPMLPQALPHQRQQQKRHHLLLQLYNQTAGPQLPHMLPWPHQSVDVMTINKLDKQ